MIDTEAQRKLGYRKKTTLLIASFFILHLSLAFILELGNDEAYYWFYTQHLQWNYFDHPPLVAVWAKIFTANLLLDDYEVFVRLGSVVGCALSTWFMFKAVALLHSEKAGWFAAILYNTSFYASIVAGIFIMPDAPQMIFWTLAMWMFVGVLKNNRSWGYWVWFGIATGLCIMSKVHGMFLWIGLIAYCSQKKREWLNTPHIYVSLLITAIVASPILIWNAANDFVTYRFHSERVNIIGWAVNFKNFLPELLGQFFFNNPFNVVLIFISLFALKQKKLAFSGSSFFLWTGLPLVIILLFVSLFRPIFPHWSGPGYVSLIPVAAIYLADTHKRNFPGWLHWSVAGFLVFVIAMPLIISFYPGTWGSTKEQNYGHGDVSLDRYGWRSAGKEFRNYFRKAVVNDSVPAKSPLVCNTWWGAHVEYYFARPAGTTMIGLNAMHEIHQYGWTNEFRKHSVDMSTAFSIVPSDEFYDAPKHYSTYYNNIQLVKTIQVNRRGMKARHFNVYRLSGWKGWRTNQHK